MKPRAMREPSGGDGCLAVSPAFGGSAGEDETRAIAFRYVRDAFEPNLEPVQVLHRPSLT